LQRQRLGPYRIRQGTADIAAGKPIGDKSGVHKSFSGSDDYPGLWVYRLLSAIRFGLTSDFSHSHQTSALLPTDINPLTSKSVPLLSHSINTAIFSVDLADAFCQSNRRANDAS